MAAVPGVTSALASGAGSVPLQLGGVTFATQECPDDLPIGALEQMLAVHHLVGGGVVVQSFGVKPKSVTWHGKLFDQNVAIRVQQLRLYAVAGGEIPVSWGSERYFGVIRDFTPHFLGGYAEYDITLEITRDNNGAFTVASPTSIDAQVAALQSQADTQNTSILAADPTGAAAFQPQLSAVDASIQSAGPIAQNITVAGPAISTAAQTAIAGVTTYQKGLSPTAAWLPNVLLLLSSLQGIVANVQRGQAPKSLLTQGGSLFQIAAQQYGDVTRAFDLAAANGLPSPFISALKSTQVALPPFASGS